MRPSRDVLRSHQRALRLLRSEVSEAQPHSGATVWSEYYEEHADIRFPGSARGPDWNAKHRTVCDLLERLQPVTVNSFGCNRGWYEQQAASLGARVVCSDVDGKAIARLYADARENHLHLLPLILDVLNPSPGLGVGNTQWAPATERLRCDLVMALALTHHLTLEHKVGFEDVVASLSAFADRWLLVEFVPAGDAHLARWCPVVPEWYSLDRFQTTLLDHYRTVTRFDSHPSPRVLLLCEK